MSRGRGDEPGKKCRGTGRQKAAAGPRCINPVSHDTASASVSANHDAEAEAEPPPADDDSPPDEAPALPPPAEDESLPDDASALPPPAEEDSPPDDAPELPPPAEEDSPPVEPEPPDEEEDPVPPTSPPVRGLQIGFLSMSSGVRQACVVQLDRKTAPIRSKETLAAFLPVPVNKSATNGRETFVTLKNMLMPAS